MARKKPFTEEQIQILSQNPYTHAVSPMRISFTLAFKQMFYEQTRIPGMTTKKILIKAGYDPTWFTKGCCDQLRKNILQQAASPEGLKPPRGLSAAERKALLEKQDLSKKVTDETTIRQLQERVAHLEDQIEFLKKFNASGVRWINSKNCTGDNLFTYPSGNRDKFNQLIFPRA